MYRLSLAALACLAAFLVGCGGDDQPETTPKPSPAAAQAADLQPIKDYLLDHTERLVRSTEQLQRDAQEYYDLAKASNFDYAKLLADNRDAVATSMKELQADFVQANPDYEQMEGVVAGVPSLADYDVIIDAGADKSDPDNAVPFSITTEDGRTFEQPGNFFFLLESSIYGTEPKFVAENVTADLDGDGKVAFPEALPDAKFLVAATTDFAKNAKDLDESSKKWDPTLEDAFTAMVVMTPTMSEYFDSWKASRFIQGGKSGEKSFVATSRLSDISDILSGLVLIYESIQPAVEKVDKQQAGQTKVSLEQLHQFSQRLFNEEQGGKTFTPDDADTLGSEAQRRAEAIAGQISQAAGQLNLKLED